MKPGPARVTLRHEGGRRSGQGNLKQEEILEGKDDSSYQWNSAIRKQDVLSNLDCVNFISEQMPWLLRKWGRKQLKAQRPREKEPVLAWRHWMFFLSSLRVQIVEDMNKQKAQWDYEEEQQTHLEKGKWTFPNGAPGPFRGHNGQFWRGHPQTQTPWWHFRTLLYSSLSFHWDVNNW